MTLFIVGDSHTAALADAMRRSPDLASDLRASDPATPDRIGPRVAVGLMFPFSRTMAAFHRDRGDGIGFADDEATEWLAALTGSETFLPAGRAVYGLTMAYTTNLILWRSAWFWCRPWRVAKPGLNVVSDQVVEAIVDAHFAHVLAFLEALTGAGTDYFVIEAPPLRSDDRCLTTGRVELEAILEIERISRARIDARLARQGIDVVHCPAESYSGAPRESLLRDDMRNIRPADQPIDTHHANHLYGAAMLRAVYAYLDRRATAARAA